MRLLRHAERPYAWGSRTAIATLLGAPVPAPHPQAELWLGAHPADPSRLLGANGQESSLLDELRADPDRHLGSRCRRQWGSSLPFLLKLLAAEEPLSLQAHPSAEQAAEGFARENQLGLPLDAPERNYKDPSHKPELLCALTEFVALAGFRDVATSVELLSALADADAENTPMLKPYRDLLAGQPDSDGLRALLTTWITSPQSKLDALLSVVLEACVDHVRHDGEFKQDCRTLLELGEAHPGDVGVLAAALLNRIVLQPGEAMYLPAGKLHTYLRGTGVEIMANSDNVLRGGLTPKHVDVPELLRVLDFSHGDLPRWIGEPAGQHEIVYRTPACEFQLSRLGWGDGETGPVALAQDGPQILLCTAGVAELVAAGQHRMTLRRGQAAWLAAADPPVDIHPLDCPAQVFRARVPGDRGLTE